MIVKYVVAMALFSLAFVLLVFLFVMGVTLYERFLKPAPVDPKLCQHSLDRYGLSSGLYQCSRCDAFFM